jgi:hypothetical protein
MPYDIVKYKTGFRAIDNQGKALSNKPMTKSKVRAQIIAVHMSKLNKTGKSNVFKNKKSK